MIKYTFLTNAFYNDYQNCSEIEHKPKRPYAKVIIELNQYIFAIPLRSNINHKYVLWTDKENHCGLDFSKTVVITKPEYIDNIHKPYIRPNEFNALRGKEYEIKQRLIRYIEKYKKAKSRQDIPRNKVLTNFSTLQYFEDYI